MSQLVNQSAVSQLVIKIVSEGNVSLSISLRLDSTLVKGPSVQLIHQVSQKQGDHPQTAKPVRTKHIISQQLSVSPSWSGSIVSNMLKRWPMIQSTILPTTYQLLQRGYRCNSNGTNAKNITFGFYKGKNEQRSDLLTTWANLSWNPVSLSYGLAHTCCFSGV